MLQAQFMLPCNLIKIQKPRPGQPLFQKFLRGLAGRVWHVPARVHEDCVLGDIQGVHEERCGILGGEGPSRKGNVQEWPGTKSTTILEDSPDHDS